MDNEQAEFDRYADEYRAIHAANIRLSGESVDYFAHYKVREVALATADSCSSNPVILDFGAGVCNSTPYFLTEFNAPQLVCADVSHRSLLLGKRAFETQAGFVCFDGSHLPFADQTFEIIFVACVLHHVAHSEHPAILSELRRILQPRGHLFIFEHNPWNPLTRHAVNTCPFDTNAHLISPWSMRRCFVRAGFKEVVLNFCIFFPHALRVCRPLERQLRSLPLGAQYYVVGRN